MLPCKVSKSMSNKFLNYLPKEDAIELLRELEDTRSLHGKITKAFEEVRIVLENQKEK